MNKDLINQLPADEQPVASKLDSVASDMKLSSAFQWDLENQLMDTYKTKSQPLQSWQSRIMPVLGWAIVAIAGVFLLNWTIRSESPETPLAEPITAAPEISFADRVRRGDICEGPLALAHGFDVFLTNEDKTGFFPVDTGNALYELRSFAWSADGERLAIIGNTTGSGKIYITDPTDGEVGYLLSGSETGYVRDASWSRDGRRFVIWSSQNITTLYLLNADGSGMVEKQLELQIIGTPQFTPDGTSVVFFGADTTAAGLFELNLESSQLTLLNSSVEDESGFAFSPDGLFLSYMEYDRDEGEARLFTQDLRTDERRLLGMLPIPRNSGASLPDAANLRWSPDGTLLVFDLGQPAAGRSIYLARTDGAGMVEVVDSGYAPAISSDGRCLAHISGKQVFLLDLAEVASNSVTATPVLLADMPVGRGRADTRLDKLQWQP